MTQVKDMSVLFSQIPSGKPVILKLCIEFVYDAEKEVEFKACHLLYTFQNAPIIQNIIIPYKCNTRQPYIGETFDCPLSDLQFGYDEDIPEEDHLRYRIAKLFFEHGADPNLLLEGETIYDSVTFSIYNDGCGPSWPYRVEFYKLLVMYGGGGYVYKNGAHGYGKPEFSEPIDLSRVDEYQVCFRRHEDGYHIEGHLLNPDGKDIGIL